MNFKFCKCNEIQNQSHDSVLVDVREKAEYDSVHIPGSVNFPLSELEGRISQLDSSKTHVVICKSGIRSQRAAQIFIKNGFENIYVLHGGLEAWKQEARPLEKGERQVWAMDRQVRGVAGTLTLLGIVLGFTVHPAGYFISAFVGAGLVYSAISDTCTMALILSKMPWNQPK
jgi:rhodanese-related sulfurtransferase